MQLPAGAALLGLVLLRHTPPVTLAAHGFAFENGEPVALMWSGKPESDTVIVLPVALPTATLTASQPDRVLVALR